MDEISRCREVIGVKEGASLEEVKKAYRDLVQVWHPDRFANNERLQSKAQERLKEINGAYDYLMAQAFENGIVAKPPVPDVQSAPEGEPDATEEPTRGMA